jgi:hypothetical protein
VSMRGEISNSGAAAAGPQSLGRHLSSWRREIGKPDVRVLVVEPIVVAVVANEVEADTACGLLRTEGIRWFHRLTRMASLYADGTVGSFGPREVLVEPSNVERAHRNSSPSTSCRDHRGVRRG